ncbi:MAG: GNAT family N-acetyltransferase [Verrucomicrobia bacterium]|nr:GNAT family N-acetyltransferase [Verrucomicrobiota bacterium]
MSQPPEIPTTRLRLLAPGPSCAEAYRRFYTDAAASAAYGGPLTAGQADARLAKDVAAWTQQGFGVWAVQRREQGDIIGTCGFWQGPGWPRELTWWLLPEARGQGYAKEASQTAIRHAYDVFGWAAVETYMEDANHEARALVVRLGGQRVDRRVFPDGKERDFYRFPRPVGG